MSKNIVWSFVCAFAVVTAAGCSYQKSSPTAPGQAATETSAPPAPGEPAPAPSPAPNGASRAADPAPGDRLPLPNMAHVVHQVANQYPDALRNSCGNWEFMDRVVDELRRHDTRWGYNWKRGNVGDASEDVVDYHYSGGQDEGNTEVYIIDIIVGHCGGNPQPGWGDVTEDTRNHGTIGRWTGRGRF